jgi:hypothetical protein
LLGRLWKKPSLGVLQCVRSHQHGLCDGAAAPEPHLSERLLDHQHFCGRHEVRGGGGMMMLMMMMTTTTSVTTTRRRRRVMMILSMTMMLRNTSS